MRAFVEVRKMLTEHRKEDKFSLLEERIDKIETYINEILVDQNDINEDTRMQLELIEETIAELQRKKQQK